MGKHLKKKEKEEKRQKRPYNSKIKLKYSKLKKKYDLLKEMLKMMPKKNILDLSLEEFFIKDEIKPGNLIIITGPKNSGKTFLAQKITSNINKIIINTFIFLAIVISLVKAITLSIFKPINHLT